MAIQHFCSECGNQVEEYCAEHPHAPLENMAVNIERECARCLDAGIHTPATTHSTNPDWSKYDLCAACAAEYDSRPTMRGQDEP
jgi:hypothetical protein